MIGIHHKTGTGCGNIFETCNLQVQIAGVHGNAENFLDMIPTLLLGIIIHMLCIVAELGIKARYFRQIAQYH